MSERWFVEKVAEYCRVSTGTIYNWVCNKPDFPRPIRIGRYNEWDMDDIVAWCDARFASTREDNKRRRETLLIDPGKKVKR